MTKALTYEQLLLLGPDAIRELYPFGAKEWKKRWIPVLEGEEPDRPLKRLLKDKKATLPTSRLMHRDSSRGYTDNPAQAIRVRPDSGEAVDKESQNRITEGAHQTFSTLRGRQMSETMTEERERLRVLLEAHHKLARVKGVDIRSDLRVIERRIEAIDKKLKEAA